MFPSRFLSQVDLVIDKILTIASVEQCDVSGDAASPDFAWVMKFHDDVKPLLLNYPLALILAQILKSADTREWLDRRIVLYWDSTVYYSGRLVGGIRARVPQLIEHEVDKVRRKSARRAS
jgi:hypothetical protein